ncbi:hypothetical protein [Nocardia sp. X0981]
MDISDMFNDLHLLEVDERSHGAAAFRDVIADEAQANSGNVKIGTVIGALIAALNTIERRVSALEDEMDAQ